MTNSQLIQTAFSRSARAVGTLALLLGDNKAGKRLLLMTAQDLREAADCLETVASA